MKLEVENKQNSIKLKDGFRRNRMIKLIKIDEEYAKWISDISKRFRQSQLKAAVKVNDEMLRFYWRLGHDISARERNHDY